MAAGRQGRINPHQPEELHRASVICDKVHGDDALVGLAGNYEPFTVPSQFDAEHPSSVDRLTVRVRETALGPPGAQLLDPPSLFRSAQHELPPERGPAALVRGTSVLRDDTLKLEVVNAGNQWVWRARDEVDLALSRNTRHGIVRVKLMEPWRETEVSAIAKLNAKLGEHPHVRFVDEANTLRIPPVDPEGFEVALYEPWRRGRSS